MLKKAPILEPTRGNMDYSKNKLSVLIENIKEIVAADKYNISLRPGAKDESISRFEQINNFKFPILVKEWMLFTDGCNLFDNSVQFYGINHSPFIEVKPAGITDN